MKPIDDTNTKEALLKNFTTEGMDKNKAERQQKVLEESEKKDREAFVSSVEDVVADLEQEDYKKWRDENLEAQKLLSKLFPENNVGGAMRLAAIAAGHVIDDIESNINLTNKSELEGIKENTPYASRENIQTVIGRSLVSSYGIKIAETENDSHVDAYNKIGEVGFALLEEMGYIKTKPVEGGLKDTGYQNSKRKPCC